MPLVFSFSGSRDFKCNLECSQCTATNASGFQCKNRVCIGVPLCWMHLLQKNKVRILPSAIPGAGKGLFALDKSVGANAIIFKKGDNIVKYEGEKISHEATEGRYGNSTAPYTIYVKDNLYEDAACVRGIGSIANHGTNGVANARFSVKGGYGQKYIGLVAIKPIKNNQEILVNYGSAYTMNESNVAHNTSRKRL